MRKDQTSMTAMGIAIVRGIESEKPESVRTVAYGYAIVSAVVKSAR